CYLDHPYLHSFPTRRSSDLFTISGDGKQVRDLLFVDDCVSCYFAAAEKIADVRGQAFNIGGGMVNSSSLLELFEMLERELNVKLDRKSTRLNSSHRTISYAV